MARTQRRSGWTWALAAGLVREVAKAWREHGNELLAGGYQLWTNAPIGTLVVESVKSQGPAHTVIRFTDGKTVVVNSKDRRFEPYAGETIGPEYMGSGAPGVFVLTLPVYLWVSPVLLAIRAGYRVGERLTRMSRYHEAMLKQVRGQVDEEHYALLRDAAIGEWEYYQHLAGRPNFQEAQTLLRTLHLEEYVQCVPHRDTSKPDKVTRYYAWKDGRGYILAQGVYRDDQPTLEHALEVTVCAEPFDGEEAQALLRCYSEHIVVPDTDDDAP